MAGETAIYGLSSIVGRFLNFLLTPFYTAYVFASDLSSFGIVTELYSYIVFLLIFLTLGFETGYFRFVNDDAHKNSTFSTLSTTLFFNSLFFVVLILLFIDPITSVLKYQDNKELIILLAIIVAIDAFTCVPFAKLRQQEKSKRFALLKIINIFVNIGFNVIFYFILPKFYYIDCIKDLFDIDNKVLYVFLSNLIASIVTLLMLLPEIFSEKYTFDIKLLKKVLPYSFPILLAGLAGQTNEIIDRPLFKHLVTIPDYIIGDEAKNIYVLSQLGIYGANFKLAQIITMFIQAFRYSFEPMFFKSGKGLDKKLQYSKIMTLFVLFCLSMFLMIMLYIDFFKYFIGKEYRAGLHIVPIVLMSQMLFGILVNLALWYKLTDKTKYGLLIAGVGAIITIVFNYILTPLYGYVGAAWTHVICYVIIVTLSFLLGRKFFPIPYQVTRILLYIIFALTLYLLSSFVEIDNVLIKTSFNTFLFATFLFVAIKKEKILEQLKRNSVKHSNESKN